ncbi:MAG TPA: phage tail tape measure protein, partial [Gallicola sp.]|nr:phage tail tape measure protein [Gallicola sp.]
MDNLSIIIKALLEKKSKEDIIDEIKQIQNITDKSPLKIKIDIDNAEFKNFAENLKRVNNNINEINNNITKSLSLSTHEYDKLIKIYKGELSEGQAPDVKIKEITDAYGRQIQTIKKLDAETNSYVVTETKVIDNQKKRLAEEKKISTTIENEIKLLQTRIQLLKQNYWTGDFTEIDKFAERLNVSLIDPANYKTQLADLKNEYQLIANTIQESHRNNFSALEKEIQLENQKNASVMQNWVKQLEIDAEIRKAESDRIKNQMQINAQIESQTLKLQQQLDLFKQKMLGGEGIAGQLDIFAKKQKGRYDKSTLDQLRKDIEALTIDTPNLGNEIKKLEIRFSSLKMQATQSGNIMVRALENAYKFLRYYLVGGFLVRSVNEIKKAINSIVELDTSLTELNKVVDISNERISKFVDEAYELGNTLGRTGKQVIDATTEFARAGYTLEESFKLSKAALLMMNVAEGINTVEEASSSLISVLRSYKMEVSDAVKIVDI